MFVLIVKVFPKILVCGLTVILESSLSFVVTSTDVVNLKLEYVVDFKV